MLKKISPHLPALISSSAILCATFFSQSKFDQMLEWAEKQQGK
ncbi:MAG: hypothetical protein Q3M24_06555 [Candidatus Electrothrix aestuarii]|uniref:Uncharacterized protein n=1 Tax=Candidatus Electrothrix aestuarii TaxID=3062594 RepID=A0AAU8LZ53_9BACT|nr:hypothetical protein [Candidatus Electrothrix aestuarii]